MLTLLYYIVKIMVDKLQSREDGSSKPVITRLRNFLLWWENSKATATILMAPIAATSQDNVEIVSSYDILSDESEIVDLLKDSHSFSTESNEWWPKWAPARYNKLNDDEKEQYLELLSWANIDDMLDRVSWRIYYWYVTEKIWYTKDIQSFMDNLSSKWTNYASCSAFFRENEDWSDSNETMKNLNGISWDAWCGWFESLTLGNSYNNLVAIQWWQFFDLNSFPNHLADMSLTLPWWSTFSPSSNWNIVVFWGSNWQDVQIDVMPNDEWIDSDNVFYRTWFSDTYVPYPLQVDWALLPLLDVQTNATYDVSSNTINHSVSFENQWVEEVRSVIIMQNWTRIPMQSRPINPWSNGLRETINFRYEAEVWGRKLPAWTHQIAVESRDAWSQNWRTYSDIEVFKIPHTFNVDIINNWWVNPRIEFTWEIWRVYNRRYVSYDWRVVNSWMIDWWITNLPIEFWNNQNQLWWYVEVWENGAIQSESYNVIWVHR